MDKTKSVDIKICHNIDDQHKISGYQDRSEYRWTRQNQWISTQCRILNVNIKSVHINIGQNMECQDKISGYQCLYDVAFI